LTFFLFVFFSLATFQAAKTIIARVASDCQAPIVEEGFERCVVIGTEAPMEQWIASALQFFV